MDGIASMVFLFVFAPVPIPVGITVPYSDLAEMSFW